MLQAMMETMAMRRVRIDSKEDVILLIVVAVVYCLSYFLLGKLKPDMSDKARQIISFVITIIIGCVVMFTVL